jgi:hypothetical protein
MFSFSYNISMAENFIAKLDKIGFTWEVKVVNAWIARYKILTEYKHEF